MAKTVLKFCNYSNRGYFQNPFAKQHKCFTNTVIEESKEKWPKLSENFTNKVIGGLLQKAFAEPLKCFANIVVEGALTEFTKN